MTVKDFAHFYGNFRRRIHAKFRLQRPLKFAKSVCLVLLWCTTQGIYFGRGNLAKNLRNFLLKTTNFIGLPLEK